MLRSVLVVTGSGKVVFEKEWRKLLGTKTGMFGGLTTAMQEMARQALNMRVSYLEFPDVAVSIAHDAKTSFMCAVLHDEHDGPSFGRVIAQTILTSFLQEFQDEHWGGVRPSSNAKLAAFSAKLVDVIASAPKTILQELRDARCGVASALLVYDDGTTVMVGDIQHDQVSVVANLQALLTFSSEILSSKEDVAQVMTLEMMKQVVLIQRIQNASFVCVCRKSEKRDAIHLTNLRDTAVVLEQVLTLIENLSC
eukprot:TRINITY_DN7517_c0_g1_i1.p1 TRINITY_DN7517_c0_g1~~TRINITY_DN7517_c0_g1_i1.p1  ORF type:complete len:252 (+),score=37.24 TRINITY_DN7517_c0_g1_i1:64-819(+)